MSTPARGLAVTGPREGKAFPAGADIPLMESLVRAMRASAEHDCGG